jgi:hypothetical protein
MDIQEEKQKKKKNKNPVAGGFMFQTNDVKHLSMLMYGFKDLKIPIPMRVTKDKILMTTTAADEEMLLNVELLKNTFLKYECDGVYDISFDPCLVHKLIYKSQQYDTIEFFYSVKKPVELKIIIYTEGEENTVKEARIGLLNVPFRPVESKVIETDLIGVMKTDDLVKAISIFRPFDFRTNWVRITMDQIEVKFEMEGDYCCSKACYICRFVEDEDEPGTKRQKPNFSKPVVQYFYLKNWERALKCFSSELGLTTLLVSRSNPIQLRSNVGTLGSIKISIVGNEEDEHEKEIHNMTKVPEV